ncbi:MAG: 6-phosphogluconolactonase [Patescibacteria group bacterium]
MIKTPIIHTFPTETLVYDTAQYIADFLVEKLKKDSVLLLLSGGSAITMYEKMFEILIEKTIDLHNLSVSLFDERFVSQNSLDSNELQLRNAGVITQLMDREASWIPYLNSEQEENGKQVAQRVTQALTRELSLGKQLIILAGMGDDGHTAGLLPVQQDSPNRSRLFDTDQFVAYYQVDSSDSNNPFSYRLTATPALIKEAHHVFLYTAGEKKRPALQHFMNQDGPIHRYPVISLLASQQPVEVLTDITV